MWADEVRAHDDRPATAQAVTLPKAELFEMLDVINEMVIYCSANMPVDRYRATANAVSVIAKRAHGDDAEADRLKVALLHHRERLLAEKRAR